MSLTTTSSAWMPVKTLRTRSTRPPARGPGPRRSGTGPGFVPRASANLTTWAPPGTTSVSRPSRATLARACIVGSKTSGW